MNLREIGWNDRFAGDLTEARVVAANVDTVFLITGLDGNFNLRRMERYLTAAWDSGASPVIVLNKADLRPNLDETMAEVESIARGAPVVAVSAKGGFNLDALGAFLAPGRTVAMLGSSEVGKSTLINRLLREERLRIRPVREDDSRGRQMLRIYFKFKRRRLGDLCRCALRSLTRYFEVVTGSALMPGVMVRPKCGGDDEDHRFHHSISCPTREREAGRPT